METDASGGRSRRSTWLLAALAVLVVAYGAVVWWPGRSAGTTRPPAGQSRASANRAQPAVVDPADLNVRLEALETRRPDPGEAERNPFRFKPKPAPPPPPPVKPPTGPVQPPGPPPPPPVPPIDLRFMGVIDHPTLGKLAAFSNCKGFTVEGQEGKIMDGRYRVVRIGVESVVIEYANGTGRRTIPLSGCPPR
jgi:hypothetical protein